MNREDREWHRHGSARFAERADLLRAGMLTQTPTSLFPGFCGGRPIWCDGDGGLLMVAGARSGKLRDILAYNLFSGICSLETILLLDPKGELAAISQNQTPDGKHCRYWNPLALHGLPQDRVNPVGHLKWSSPTLFSDMKVFQEQFLPRSGSANGVYFELNARRWGEAIGLALVKRNGVLTLPDYFRAISSIPEGGRDWLDLAWEMHASGIDACRSVEAEIHAGREDSSGGFRGILGELQKSVACLSDPVLRDSVSPPFDFDLADLCRSAPAMQVYLMAPPEMISPWAPVIKAIFTTAMVLKSRAPQALRQTWILDECAQLKGFDLVPKLFAYGAGIGVRPWAVFQTEQQMNALGKDARSIICSSASVQSWFGLRDLESAKRVSEMMGAETLDYDDPLAQGRAGVEARRLLGDVLSGGDAFRAAPRLAQQMHAAVHRAVQRRSILTPDEVMHLPPDRQLIFADGLPGPIYAGRAPYWTQRWLAGRYHPNPYHPPLDSVLVQTRFGPRRRPVLTGNVPAAFADLPQYRDGTWSWIGDEPT
ncbi:type IV secretory system conjugative DNA transfer family protein [Albimonas pacifica]|uniref:Type IV secretion system protein VirD4 n=1 Tax=Albimonas pacifica TaxID=1114924 RepID=A0A1I3NZS6_9RHOB|nr:type IV secretory system conjugative DNA transfer family protein [Albimonas pacifica]SFJ14803.1 type IV secretion system protein VirD4 [Albimonas pacifica]